MGMAVFTIEFFLRLLDMRCGYFKDSWNIFDLVVLLLGLGILVANSISVATSKTIAGSNLSQTARVLRIIRAVRLVRLVKSWEVVRAVIAGDMASVHTTERIHRLCILLAFIRAHTVAQQQLVRFLGRHGKLDNAMLARCIIQSQTDVYQAMLVFIYQEVHVDEWLLDEKEACENNIEALSKMEAFVNDARDGGVVSISEAECLKHTVHHYIRMLMDRIEDVCEGRAQEPLYAQIDPGVPDGLTHDFSEHSRAVGSLFEPCLQDLITNKVEPRPARAGPGPKVVGAPSAIASQAELGHKEGASRLASNGAKSVKQSFTEIRHPTPGPMTLGFPSPPKVAVESHSRCSDRE